MTPYMLTQGSASLTTALGDLSVRNFLRHLPDATVQSAPSTKRAYQVDPKHEAVWSCHGLCRAVINLLHQPWRVIDGWFIRPGNQHAWLYVDMAGGRDRFILDAYPIAAVGGPLLLDAGAASPWREAYIERSMAYVEAEREQFRQEGIEALAAWQSHGTGQGLIS